MPALIHFRSPLFDAARERVNPINPIRGLSVLEWLRSRLPAEASMTDPEPEDWGWASDVEWQGRRYLVGAGASEEVDGATAWMLQVVPRRSLKARLLGRGKMVADDAFLARLVDLLRSEPTSTGIEVDHDA